MFGGIIEKIINKKSIFLLYVHYLESFKPIKNIFSNSFYNNYISEKQIFNMYIILAICFYFYNIYTHKSQNLKDASKEINANISHKVFDNIKDKFLLYLILSIIFLF